jgi:hypothetical protein
MHFAWKKRDILTVPRLAAQMPALTLAVFWRSGGSVAILR